jgi:hypothetical protein
VKGFGWWRGTPGGHRRLGSVQICTAVSTISDAASVKFAIGWTCPFLLPVVRLSRRLSAVDHMLPASVAFRPSVLQLARVWERSSLGTPTQHSECVAAENGGFLVRT